MKEEIELFGVLHARRGAWSDEALRVIRACWAPGERPSFHGELFAFDERRQHRVLLTESLRPPAAKAPAGIVRPSAVAVFVYFTRCGPR